MADGSEPRHAAYSYNKERALDLWASGVDAPTVADRMDVPVHAINTLVSEARARGDARAIAHSGGPSGNWTDALEDQLRALWTEGKTCRQIAAILRNGITKNAVIGKSHRLKLPPRAHPIKLARIRRKPEGSGRVRAIAKARKTLIRFRGETPLKQLHSGQGVPDTLVMTLHPLGNPVSILKRTERQCSYIAGDAEGPATLMCGAPVERHSLCAFHIRLCWQPRLKHPTNLAGRRQRSSLVPFIGEVPFS